MFVQLQPRIISFNNICSTSTRIIFIQQRSSRTFKISSFNKIPRPVPSKIRYFTDPVPDHMVHEIKMASEAGAGRDVTEELTQIVRECVRNEIALQRSGRNTSLLRGFPSRRLQYRRM